MKYTSRQNKTSQAKNNRGLLLGRKLEAKPKIGFSAALSGEKEAKLISHDGEGHIMTIGKTGSGKSRNMVTPNLLVNQGSIVVFDLKGELYRTTARRRREMGQRMIVLDPFNRIIAESDHLNPFDAFELLKKNDIDVEAQNMAEIFAQRSNSKNPFWDLSGVGDLGGVRYYHTRRRAEHGNSDADLSQRRRGLFAGD